MPAKTYSGMASLQTRKPKKMNKTKGKVLYRMQMHQQNEISPTKQLTEQQYPKTNKN